jgi:hypothetical protein
MLLYERQHPEYIRDVINDTHVQRPAAAPFGVAVGT